jgi:hypothetical protein
MRRDDEERIERLAEDISAGRSVDPGDGADLDAEGSAIVANLIALSRLSELHRVPEPSRIAATGAVAETWGSLRILEKVGEGAFGEVFRAWDTELHRQVALKVARSGDGGRDERLVEEGRLLARVDHPNVVRVHGGAVHDGRSGLWMEFVDGVTLETSLREGGPLEPAEAASVGRDLGEALAAIHSAGLVHGDVKAQNVMREADGRVVLMDFGAGSRTGTIPSELRRTGTPMVTPPEILAGEVPSPRSDVYSLGVLLFLALSGRFPVEADTVDELVRKVRAGEGANLRALRPDVPRALARVVAKATAADPETRYRTAAEMAEALAPFAPSAKADAVVIRRRRAAALAPWVLALAAVVVALVFLLRGPATSPLVADARLLRGSDPAVQLFSGDRVQPGDLLHLRLDLRRESHVYVLNRDDRGALSLIFPMPGYARQNPLPAARDLSLPGVRTGHSGEMAWRIGPGGGTERFLVIASRRPLREFEEELRGLPTPEAGASARALGESAAENLYRGVTGLAQLPAVPATEGSAGERLFALAKSLADGGDVWVREFALRNPAP